MCARARLVIIGLCADIAGRREPDARTAKRRRSHQDGEASRHVEPMDDPKPSETWNAAASEEPKPKSSFVRKRWVRVAALILLGFVLGAMAMAPSSASARSERDHDVAAAKDDADERVSDAKADAD